MQSICGGECSCTLGPRLVEFGGWVGDGSGRCLGVGLLIRVNDRDEGEDFLAARI